MAEHMDFGYSDEERGLDVGVHFEETDMLTLDTVLEKFQQFLYAAGWNYVWIDEVGDESFNRSWVITKDSQRSN